MHEQPSQGIKPGLPEPMEGPGSTENAFSLRHKFPGQDSVPTSVPPVRPAGRRKSFWRLFVPLALFVVMIGGVAFLVQYLPNWRSKKNTVRPPQPKEVLVFPEKISIWDPKDKEKILDANHVPYIKEFEAETPGHYDYSFRNTGSENGKSLAAEMGIYQPTCDCASVQAFLLSESQLTAWEKAKPEEKASILKNPITLKPDERKGIVIPPQSCGVVRVNWNNRRTPPYSLRFNVRVWAQPKGKMEERTFIELETRALLVPPVQFDQAELSLGAIAPGAVVEAQCLWWSSTRSKVDLKVVGGDPLVTWTITRFTPAERAEFEKQLRAKNINIRIQVAGRLSVKVVEEKDKRQLEQGPLNRLAPLSLDDQPLAIVPRVVGRVTGEVEVGSSKDHGKIDLLNFSSSKGKKRRIVLRSEPGTVLMIDSQKPSYLKVVLKANKETSPGQKKSWFLDVEVPPGSHVGPFLEDSAVILKTQATPPRYIRIPILGNASPG
jgi:hypothetical protein